MQAWRQGVLHEQEGLPFDFIIMHSSGYPPHWHEDIEIVYVKDGELNMQVNNEHHKLLTRDILLISSGEVHHFLPQNTYNETVVIQLGLNFFGTLFSVVTNRRFVKPLLDNSLDGSGKQSLQTYEKIEREIKSAILEYERKSEGFQLAFKAKLYELASILIRDVPMEKYTTVERIQQKDYLDRLEKVLQYISNNYMYDISLDEAAKITGLSICQFDRYFKKTIGMTFLHFLNDYRVRKSEYYLTETEFSITDIALKSGFGSIETYNRVFRQLRGCTPSAFRKSKV